MWPLRPCRREDPGSVSQTVSTAHRRVESWTLHRHSKGTSHSLRHAVTLADAKKASTWNGRRYRESIYKYRSQNLSHNKTSCEDSTQRLYGKL